MSVRVYKRVVLRRCATRKDAEQICDWYQTPVGERIPVGEYAVEYTAVHNQREPWRVVHILPVPPGTPDSYRSRIRRSRIRYPQISTNVGKGN